MAIIAAKDEVITSLQARTDRAEQRADQAWKLVEQWAAGEKAAKADLETAQTEAKQARIEVEQFRQADAARKGQGRWARIRMAWRGE